jgi:galactose mutarotase-like enzyme
MLTLENEILKVVINPKGAELTSLFHKETQLEYLWNGDPAFWAKHSPVLFPIVGTLRNNQYHYQGKSYFLGRHGFAREMQFAVHDHQPDQITFQLQDNNLTHQNYPFAFRFNIRYTLTENSLAVTYHVVNPAKQTLYFSVGGHPAFAVPLTKDTNYEDYYLVFDKQENTPRWPISNDGLIENTPDPLLQHSDRLPLTKELFSKDALVLKSLKSSLISVRSDKTEHGLRFDFPGFPFLGLWAAKGADFLCIEPWCGIADSVNTSQQLEEKEGINALEPGGEFSRTWIVKVF